MAVDTIGEWTARARGTLSDERFVELVSNSIAIPSPTGHERPLSEYLAGELTRAGLQASEQVLSPERSNAVGTLKGAGGGPSLLLYSALDTLTTGREGDDVPWVGRALEAHMLPVARHELGIVTGLGAGNPKGHAVCLIAAAEAIRAAEVRLAGDLHVALCAGGMPTSGPRNAEGTAFGHFFGCTHMLSKGLLTDYAVVAKPGWNVSVEEAGYLWVEVELTGDQAYAGSRHLITYRNPIHAATTLAERLEQWFTTHAERHATTQVRPQGVVSAITGGRPETLAITPATCQLYLDVRTSPTTDPKELLHEIEQLVEAHVAELPGIRAGCRVTAYVPSIAGDPAGRLADAATRAWEAVAGRPHEPATANSGASESNLLRLHGIETVKVGMPKWAGASDFQTGMNAVDVSAMHAFTSMLIGLAIELCMHDAS